MRWINFSIVIFPRANEGASDSLSARLPWPEDRRADAHVGGACADRELEILAHAHADERQRGAPGKLGQAAEERLRRLSERRNAHQADDGQLVVLAAGGDEGGDVVGGDARLLR